ncbi:unnamed protein product [Mycena citricolor]|uniref:U3 small nucleolar RNA-associated protein 25 n=1 Tax=Mycena citricolor TaxID=2018698 RepID=A0AAD2Q6E2_9AGAR|nr:unnamed protein product [Mycena citricolor]
MDAANATTTKLLTLLNVSAIKAGKRKWEEVVDVPAEKLNKRKSARFVEDVEPTLPTVADIVVDETEDGEEAKDGEDDKEEGPSNSYEDHFGRAPSVLTESARTSVDNHAWSTSRSTHKALGSAVEYLPQGLPQTSSSPSSITILERLMNPFKSRQAKGTRRQTDVQNELLAALSTHRDLYVPTSSWDDKKFFREAISLHALDHVTRKRRRVLKNNERVAHNLKSDPNAAPLEDVQDQGFTRPAVLILLPFRSSALSWFSALTSHTPSPAFQIENQSRFLSEYGLAPGMVDKLATAEPGTYPETTSKLSKGMWTTTSVPLGLRRSIEKEKSADYLSSIEILIVDQMETLGMQNWEHVKFVLSHLNKLPKDSHDADFSRIKPWYLDGQAHYLRQSILLSTLETPDTRALFNNGLMNVAGKLRFEKRWTPVGVPEGIEQNLVGFDCPNPKEEADKRFAFFTSQVLPLVLKSAVQSTNTAVFVPSSFDFIRIQNYFKKTAGVSFAVLSEYSTNADVSRARQAFQSGKKAFLLISERFHFYKRYKIRGIRNFIFYGPPEHPQFYTEMLSCPFLDDDVEASDVTCRLLYSKYDWFKLERIAGTEAARELLKAV